MELVLFQYRIELFSYSTLFNHLYLQIYKNNYEIYSKENSLPFYMTTKQVERCAITSLASWYFTTPTINRTHRCYDPDNFVE